MDICSDPQYSTLEMKLSFLIGTMAQGIRLYLIACLIPQKRILVGVIDEEKKTDCDQSFSL